MFWNLHCTEGWFQLRDLPASAFSAELKGISPQSSQNPVVHFFKSILFIYIPVIASPMPLHSSFTHSPSSLLPRGGFSLLRYLSLLGPQISPGLGASSPTGARSLNPLLYMCHMEALREGSGAWSSQCMLSGWWLSHRDLPEVCLVETDGLPMGSPSPSTPSVLP